MVNSLMLIVLFFSGAVVGALVGTSISIPVRDIKAASAMCKGELSSIAPGGMYRCTDNIRRRLP